MSNEKVNHSFLQGKAEINSAFIELFQAIDAQEGKELDSSLASKLRKRCEDHQEAVLKAFEACAKELEAGEFDEKQQEEKILGALDSVMPILKDINKIQKKLQIPD